MKAVDETTPAVAKPEGEETTTDVPKEDENQQKDTDTKDYVQEEPEEEEEKGGVTLQEYLASKKTVGLKKEARKAEEVKKTGIEKVEKNTDRVETITSNLKNSELYSVAKSQGADLMNFQGGDDEFYPREERSTRGGNRRGGRGGFRGGRGGQANQGPRPNRGGQTLRVDDSDFPTLG